MTEHGRDAVARLRAVDEALARRGVPVEASERVRRNLAQHALARPFHARLRWWPMLGFIAGAALMAALLLDGRPTHAPAIAARPAAIADASPSTDAVATVEAPPRTEPTCGALVAGVARLAVGDCLQGDGVRVSASTAATLDGGDDRVELVDGEVLFDVTSRPDRALHVIAGDVDIEVVGTRFVVHQRGGLGWVSLLEGHLRVRAADGRTVELARGERLEWPPRPKLAGPPGPRRRAVSPQPPADDGLAALLEQVAALRRAGEFAAAVDRLRTADARRWSERSRQIVSYEIGTLLERQLGDAAAACAHWHEHRRRFPDGRHDATVVRSLTRLGCPSE